MMFEDVVGVNCFVLIIVVLLVNVDLNVCDFWVVYVIVICFEDEVIEVGMVWLLIFFGMVVCLMCMLDIFCLIEKFLESDVIVLI